MKSNTGTVCIAAKFKGGVLCATDTAVTTGGSRITMDAMKGFEYDGGYVMYAGTLYYAQEVELADGDDLREKLVNTHEKHKDDSDEDGCSLLQVTKDGKIILWEHYGSACPVKDYGAIGSGGDLAQFGLDLVYSKDRSEKWLREHISNIINLIAKRDGMVSPPIEWFVVRDA